MKQQKNQTCRNCGTVLDESNWAPSLMKRGERRCKSCAVIKTKMWTAAHPDYNWRKSNIERARAYDNKRRRENPEKAKANDARHYIKHKDKIKARVSKYQRAHPEEVKATQAKWRKEHKDKIKINNAKHYKEHTEEMNTYHAEWIKTHPEEYRKIMQRHSLKRRGWGAPRVILGRYFKGSHLHHMTKDVMIYIPEWLHRSIYHNLETGYNMDKINAVAMEWYEAPRAKPT